MYRQIYHFIIHLRLHYQFFILSGGYLLSALFVDEIAMPDYLLQFLNVHILLFGGATVYNSWWDKDEGPVGGLRHPPEMNKWMHPVSLGMQFTGLVWALRVSVVFAGIYGLSLLFFWLYSTSVFRWKGRPLLSLVAIGISTGSNSFLMGLLAAGSELSAMDFATAIGVAFIMLSLYPASQVYQLKEDTERGDRTFASRYGLVGVKTLFAILFPAGGSLISLTLYSDAPELALLFGFLCAVAMLVTGFMVFRLKGNEKEYRQVMVLKFLASFLFVVFILSALLVQSIQ